MIRLHALFMVICAGVALFGAHPWSFWAAWGWGAYLLGMFLSIGPWILGKVARLRVLDNYSHLEPQFHRAADALAVASAFLPVLRAVNVALASIAFGSWLIGRRRVIQTIVLFVEAVVALVIPIGWIAVSQESLSISAALCAAIPLLCMAIVHFRSVRSIPHQSRPLKHKARR